MENMFIVTIEYYNAKGNLYEKRIEPFVYKQLVHAQNYMKHLKDFFIDYFYVEKDDNVYFNEETGEKRVVKIVSVTIKTDFEIGEDTQKGEECPNTMNQMAKKYVKCGGNRVKPLCVKCAKKTNN